MEGYGQGNAETRLLDVKVEHCKRIGDELASEHKTGMEGTFPQAPRGQMVCSPWMEHYPAKAITGA
jgi:hypothetical protein